mmetsp:Transcript_3169/g.7674  ORF Transcript_3169/g.7674 Transcript_3169/m.7674 type:complete len:549 (+) Transcript_3169:52-1698(+)
MERGGSQDNRRPQHPEIAVARMVNRWASASTGTRATSAQPTLSDAGRPRGQVRHAESGEARASSVCDGASAAGRRSPLQTVSPARRRLQAIRDHLITEVVEPARRLAVLDSCEVLVIGAGPAGLSAALAARRAGADTMLIERYGCFGGVITTVGMETLGWYRYEGTEDCEGIGREMERMAQRMGGTTKWPYNDSDCLDAERFKMIADTLVTENGIRPLLHCMCVDVLKNSRGEITGAVTESKSGRQAVLAKRVIDCTGDADVAYLAGCEYTMLDVGSRMGCTTVFNVAGVDKEKFLGHVDENPATYENWSSGEWSQETTGKEDGLKSPYLDLTLRGAAASAEPDAEPISGSWSALSEAGEATNLNLVHMRGFDCTNVKDLTQAEITGRRRTTQALDALKRELPGFEKAKLRNFGMSVGVRDTRKIVGQHNLTDSDVRSQARFADAIGIFPEFIDGYNILILPTSGRYFQVPLGCMIPEGGVDNLLVAGRCVAGDKTSHAAMRNMMACTVTGQGAGAAAAVSVRDGVPLSAVNVAAVQRELRRQGVRLE